MNNEIHNRFAQVREYKKLTASQISKDLDESSAVINGYIQGNRLPNFTFLEAFLNIYDDIYEKCVFRFVEMLTIKFLQLSDQK